MFIARGQPSVGIPRPRRQVDRFGVLPKKGVITHRYLGPDDVASQLAHAVRARCFVATLLHAGSQPSAGIPGPRRQASGPWDLHNTKNIEGSIRGRQLETGTGTALVQNSDPDMVCETRQAVNNMIVLATRQHESGSSSSSGLKKQPDNPRCTAIDRTNCHPPMFCVTQSRDTPVPDYKCGTPCYG